MKTIDYVKLLRDSKEKIEINEMPKDLVRLKEGLIYAENTAYEYIESKGKRLSTLRDAIEIIQFTMNKLLIVENTYQDLLKSINDHNNKLLEKKN